MLWDRFVSVLGRRGDSYQTHTTEPANRSLSLLQTELLRRYNERHGAAVPWPVYRRTVWKELDRSFAAASEGRQLTLPTTYDAFFTAAARGIAARLERAGYDVAGDLADLIPHPSEAGLPADVGDAEPAVPVDAEVLDAALDVLHAVLRRSRDRRQRSAKRPVGDN